MEHGLHLSLAPELVSLMGKAEVVSHQLAVIDHARDFSEWPIVEDGWDLPEEVTEEAARLPGCTICDIHDLRLHYQANQVERARNEAGNPLSNEDIDEDAVDANYGCYSSQTPEEDQEMSNDEGSGLGGQEDGDGVHGCDNEMGEGTDSVRDQDESDDLARKMSSFGVMGRTQQGPVALTLFAPTPSLRLNFQSPILPLNLLQSAITLLQLLTSAVLLPKLLLSPVQLPKLLKLPINTTRDPSPFDYEEGLEYVSDSDQQHMSHPAFNATRTLQNKHITLFSDDSHDDEVVEDANLAPGAGGDPHPAIREAQDASPQYNVAGDHLTSSGSTSDSASGEAIGSRDTARRSGATRPSTQLKRVDTLVPNEQPDIDGSQPVNPSPHVDLRNKVSRTRVYYGSPGRVLRGTQAGSVLVPSSPAVEPPPSPGATHQQPPLNHPNEGPGPIDHTIERSPIPSHSSPRNPPEVTPPEELVTSPLLDANQLAINTTYHLFVCTDCNQALRLGLLEHDR
ncbi:hypothetical protein MD484_g9089, partial [Candolleomyces efflorescens]